MTMMTKSMMMQPDLFKCHGYLQYNKIDSDFGVSLIVPQDLSDYYRTLIPKYKKVVRQKYHAHITVVRIYGEKPTNLNSWGVHANKKFTFYYSNTIEDSPNYYWLNCFSKDLENIRQELGLKNDFFKDKAPCDFKKYFHITIGNKK